MNILVCSDGSARSLRVLRHAGAFADATSSQLILMRVVDPRLVAAGAARVSHEVAVKSLRSSVRAELTKDLRAARFKGRTCATIRGGRERVADAVAREARELDAGMIAMESRSSGALRRVVRGSIGNSVLARTNLPIFFTAAKTEERMQRQAGRYTIVATTDGSARSDDVLRALAPWLKKRSIRMVLMRLYVPTLGDAGSASEMRRCHRDLERQIARTGLPSSVTGAVEPIRELEKVPAGITRVANELGADAIAMSTQGHTAARYVLLGSVAAAVLGRSRLPVLMARANEVVQT